MSKRIWITWEKQRRNHTLSKALNAQLFQFDLKLNRFVRYPFLLLRTLFTFIKEKPILIFVQNPSMVLTLFAINYGKLFNIPIIVDAHNAGINPFEGTKWWANRIVDYLIREATITIVTNKYLEEHVYRKGGQPFILPDPIPSFPSYYNLEIKKKLKGKHNIFYICTYAKDEPYLEVIKAARLFKNDIYIYISGNSKGKARKFKDILPPNIILTGYLHEKEYFELLCSCDVIVDLTTRKDCLVCGAYEAIAVEKPLIISDSEISRHYFNKGVLYTDNTCVNLAEQINKAIINISSLREEIRTLKVQLITEWEDLRISFEKEILNLLSKY